MYDCAKLKTFCARVMESAGLPEEDSLAFADSLVRGLVMVFVSMMMSRMFITDATAKMSMLMISVYLREFTRAL